MIEGMRIVRLHIWLCLFHIDRKCLTNKSRNVTPSVERVTASIPKDKELINR
jgi:hypothetical protein